MQIVIEIPDAPMRDYQDLLYKIHGMAANEGLFDDKEKSQRALALKVVLDILDGIVNGTPLPKGHGRLKDEDEIIKAIEDRVEFLRRTDAIFMRLRKDIDILGCIPKIRCEVSTIIEADKESEEV